MIGKGINPLRTNWEAEQCSENTTESTKVATTLTGNGLKQDTQTSTVVSTEREEKYRKREEKVTGPTAH